MAALVLSAAGSAIGASAGLSAVGTTLLATAGSIAGTYIDNAILGVGDSGTGRSVEPFTIEDRLTSSYGRTIPLVYGTARISGNVLWLSEPQTTTITHQERVRTGKFSSKTVTTGTERYIEASLAIGLCAVPASQQEQTVQVTESDEESVLSYRSRGGVVGVRRIWADSALLYDARTFNLQAEQTENFVLDGLYDGIENQNPAEIIEAAAGLGNVPGFRGLAYLGLENLRISDFGNRIPNFTAEVIATLPRVYVEDSPEGLCEAPDGSLYAVNHLRRTVSKIDPVTLKTAATLADGEVLGQLKAHPWRMVSDAAGDLWITCKGDATVARLNPTTGVITTITVGNYPYDLTVHGDAVWVTHPTLNQLSKIDVTTLAVSTVSVSEAPWAITADIAGDLWITTASDVVRYNPATDTQTRIATGLLPWGIAVNRVSNEIWVAVSGQDYIQVIDSAVNAVTHIRNTGTYPTGVSIHPQDEHGSVAVTLLYGNQLKVYSRTYNELLEYGTVAFPGPCLHLADGRVLITQTKYNFLLMANGR